MYKNWIINICTYLLITVSFNTNASILDIVDNGLFTTDTISGLDWLDVTATQGLRYDQVSSNMTEGGRFYGWRYATSSELNTLFHNAGGDSSIQGSSFQHEGVTDSLVLLLGNNYELYCRISSEPCSLTLSYTWGILADAATQFTHYTGLLFDSDPFQADPDYFSSNHDTSTQDQRLGSYLVRQSIAAVPIPSALFLFSSGFIVLLSLFIIKKAKPS